MPIGANHNAWFEVDGVNLAVVVNASAEDRIDPNEPTMSQIVTRRSERNANLPPSLYIIDANECALMARYQIVLLDCSNWKLTCCYTSYSLPVLVC